MILREQANAAASALIDENTDRSRLGGSMYSFLTFLALVLAMIAVPRMTQADPTTPQLHGERVGDPVRNDPPLTVQPPASMDEIGIPSHGARLNGLLYLAAGPGTHPIVLFLHGYPGNERNLDLAQAVRRAGYDAVYFDYRGDFGSGGTFSFANSLEDTAAALEWIRSPSNIAKYHFDPARIAVVGHSLGGWLAIESTAHETPGVCVAGLAAWNLGWDAKRYANHPDELQQDIEYNRVTTDPAGGPIHANADELIHEMTEHAAAWDYLLQASALKSRALLLVASTRDTPDEGVERNATLAKAIHEAGGKLVRVVTFEDDHPFSSHRIALADTLIHWLRTDCAKSQSGSNAH